MHPLTPAIIAVVGIIAAAVVLILAPPTTSPAAPGVFLAFTFLLYCHSAAVTGKK